MEPCLFDGCDRKSRKGKAFCHGHEKQRERGKPMRPLRKYRELSAFERLARAISAWWDAPDGTSAEKRAKDLARVYARAWTCPRAKMSSK